MEEVCGGGFGKAIPPPPGRGGGRARLKKAGGAGRCREGREVRALKDTALVSNGQAAAWVGSNLSTTFPCRNGGRDDDHSQHERFECKLSEKNSNAPSSYEDAIGNSQSPTEIERDGGAAAALAPRASSPPLPKSVSPSGNTSQGSHNVADGSFEAHNNTEAFDEFDPRGSVSAPPPSISTRMDFFGSSSASDSISSLALVPVATSSTPSEAAAPSGSSFAANFMAPPPASALLNQSSPLASEVVPYSSAGAPVKSQVAKEKFETKSTVWADTLSRGLVDLNISGAPPMRPPIGMAPSGLGMPGIVNNPMMGMGGYGSQQQYGGGYR